jgi:hypothetical protein
MVVARPLDAPTQRVPSTPALVAALLFPAWTAAALWTGVSPWAPALLTALYLAIDLAIGLDRRDLPLRLCLLFGYGLLATIVHALAAHSAAGVFYEDEARYDAAARSLADGVPAARLGLDTGWPQVLAYLYGSLGRSLLLARYLNAAFGVLLVGVTVEIARGIESRPGSSRALYWLAGASPALLVWAVGGVRDLGVGVGAALLVAGLLQGERRWARLALGIVLATYLAPPVIWVLAAFFVGVLAVKSVEAGRLEGLAALILGMAFVGYRWGLQWAQRINSRYFAPTAQLFVASSFRSTSSITGSLQASTPFPLVAPLLVLFQPVWFAMLAEPSLRSVMQSIGGLGWWLLLPGMALGAKACWSDLHSRPIVIWAAGGLVLAAVGLLTVVQDAARLRVVALGAFFLLAWRAFDLDRSRTLTWTKRWVLIQIALAGTYWLARASFPLVTRLLPGFGA